MRPWVAAGLGVLWTAAAGAAAPAAKTYAGVTVTVGVFSSGPHGAISGPLYHWRDEWQARTGATLAIVEIPFGQLYEKIFGDLRSGGGAYDVFIGPSWFYGDYQEGKYVIPVDRFLKDPRFPAWDPKSLVLPLRKLLAWNGATYGVANDADAMILYWRKDVFANPVHRKAFKAAYGYELPAPPRTWEQVRDLAAYFDGKNFNAGTPLDAGQPGSGIVLHLKRGGQGFFHYMALSAPYVIGPGGGAADYWFDRNTFAPLIASPGHVRALERMLEIAGHGPRAQLGWSLGEAWDWFLKGRAAMIFSWGDVGALAQDPAASRIRGRLGCAALPGTRDFWDPAAKVWKTGPAVNVVANTVGASWHGVISKFSKHPEAAYDFLAMQASPRVNFWNETHGWTGINPGASFHWLPPHGTASLKAYTDAGWDPADVQAYVAAYWENYRAPRAQPYLRIPGTPEYWDALDLHLAEAAAGSVAPRAALERVAADWERITARRGRDRQLTLYREALADR